MKKAIILILAVLFAWSIVFIGCKEAAPAEEVEEAVEEAGPVTITFMSMWNEGEVIQGIWMDVINQYMADNPNVTIETVWGGREVTTVLSAEIQADNPPDIFDYSPNIINEALGKDGLALELSSMIDSEMAWNEDSTVGDIYPAGLVETGDLEGNTYTLPYLQYSSFFWYDKTMFSELGITSTPDTWTEFMDLCETLKGNGVPPLIEDGGINFYNSYYYTWLADREEGANAFREAVYDKTGASLDKPGFLAAAKKVEDLVNNGYFIDGFEGYQWPAGQIDWAQGAGAMILCHSYLPIEVVDSLSEDFEFGAFPFPGIEGAKGDQYEIDTLTSGFSILKSSEHPEVCFDLVKRWVSAEVQSRILNEALSLPVRSGISFPEQFVDIEDIISKQTGSFWAYAGGPGNIEPEWEQQVFYPLDDQLLFGEITAEEFIAQLKEQTIAFWEGK
jgi:raffinose/stachyose/melibiose transport system substrate-binding protein